jgi:hypothetical protein
MIRNNLAQLKHYRVLQDISKIKVFEKNNFNKIDETISEIH